MCVEESGCHVHLTEKKGNLLEMRTSINPMHIGRHTQSSWSIQCSTLDVQCSMFDRTPFRRRSYVLPNVQHRTSNIEHRMLQALLVLLFSISVGCKQNCDQTETRVGPAHRPALPPGVPDLTRGEGPDATKARGPHHLISSSCRAWVARDSSGSAHTSRQILLTYVQSDKPAYRSLKVGDVILGINGKYFSGYPIDQFRQGQKAAIQTEGSFDVILWRKGWEKEQIVTVDLGHKVLDFTRGDTPGTACDWTLGPTGARGWMQGRYNESYEARQILITHVHKGSPADGILRKGDVILGLNGRNFDSDCRRAFGKAITHAETEAGKGELKLRRWRPVDPGTRTEGHVKDVTIQIEVLGSYSDTTPWNCEKTRKILENACKYIVENDILNKGNKNKPVEKAQAALGLLSTGKKEHLALVQAWLYQHIEKVAAAQKAGEKLPSFGWKAWGWGYYTLVLTEYHLLTKDPKVIPAIKAYANSIAEGISAVGSWGHGMAPGHGRLGGYGAMNQAGNICWMSLILAQRCGVNSSEIEKAIAHGKIYLDHMIDRHYVPYGDYIILDPRLHDDNGKSSSAACAYSLLGDKRGTEFFSKMTIASWAVREHGHTGILWSMLWGPLGAQRAGKEACAAFLKKQSWYFDMGRRWDGGFSYDGKMGYRSGYDYDTDARKGSAENQYYGWDVTGTRILMYALPRNVLAITGKNSLTIPQNSEGVAELIEAGRPLPNSIKFNPGNIVFLKDKFENTPTEALLSLLASWSPVVRQQASVSLAKREGNHVPELRTMLQSKKRFARYGACMAIRELAKKEQALEMATDLIPLLESKDEALFAYAAYALSATKDKQGASALLKAAGKDYPGDINEYRLRAIGQAIFKRPGVLSESIDGVDRKLLLPVVGRMMQSKGGATRHHTARAVLPKLTLEEVATLWPVLTKSLNQYALTEVAAGTAGQEEIAATFTRLRIKEALPFLFEHVQKQKGHGSQNRHQRLLGFVKTYGAHAKDLLPEMEAYLAALKKNEVRDTHFCVNLAPHLETAIKDIQASTEKPDLKSIGQEKQ